MMNVNPSVSQRLTVPIERRPHRTHSIDTTAAEEFLSALLSADRGLALKLAMDALHHGETVAAVHLHLVQHAMTRIGDLWATGQISVAAQHTASAISQYVVARLYPYMPRADCWRGRVVVAGVAGELHQLGAHLVSDALEADGWSVQFLGADRSVNDIASACLQSQPHLLALSCTMETNLPTLAQTITAARYHAGAAPSQDTPLRVLVGGMAFGVGKRANAVAQSVGADAYSVDLADAVLTARIWTSGLETQDAGQTEGRTPDVPESRSCQTSIW